MLECCTSFLTTDQLTDLVEKLNREDRTSLDFQWELAVMYGLSQLGTAVHEPYLGGRKPDIQWTSSTIHEELIADVRTVSDEGLEEESPREFYRKELSRQVAKRGFDSRFFYDEPAGRLEGRYGNQKMRLLYPPIGESGRLFGDQFETFLNDIRTQNLRSHRIRLQEDDFDVTITYHRHSGSYSAGGGNPSYTVYYSPTRNPIFRALKRKAEQLRATSYSGTKGIILTDGGCDGLARSFRDPIGRTYTDEQVIQRFLAGSKSISFVITLYVSRQTEAFGRLGPRYTTGKLFLNPRARYPLSSESARELQRLPILLPPPKLDGWNAANHLRNGWDGPQKSWYTSTYITGNSMSRTIKISARSLADLLAGRISPDEFMEMHNFQSLGGNFFERLLAGGYVIRNAALEELEDEDDDHIVLVFEPDVAAGPFQVPSKP